MTINTDTNTNTNIEEDAPFDPSNYSQFFGGAGDVEDVNEEHTDNGTDSVGDSGIDGGDSQDAPDTLEDTLDYLTLPSGKKITLEQADTLASFDEFLTTNPLAWQAIQRTLQAPPILPTENSGQSAQATGGFPAQQPVVGQQQQQQQPIQQQEVIPADIADDPAMLALWNRTANAERALQTFQQQTDSRQAVERNMHMQQAIQTSRTRFMTEFKLDDAKMDKLMWYVANENIAPAFINANPMDPTSQLYKAYESTFYRTPAFRDELIHEQETSRAEEAKKASIRKRRASALSGGSGSSAPPVSAPRSRNPQEKIESIASAFGQIRENA